jgi:small-conductance mechanosensitive channel
VTELAESSVNLELRFWLKEPREELRMRLLYIERVKRALDEAGVELPFPQLTLHLDEADRSALARRGPSDGRDGENHGRAASGRDDAAGAGRDVAVEPPADPATAPR